ncbi:MAG: hypothetical protein XD82_1529 [Methanoculleus marisnigri]|uniref:Uncharacterized protein n=1 Tax=Methanoculleus marisnigri TaxID=2198 RepID=A0A101GLQ3_9EURY|nr:MAG: hypothetical protein XD82_1529 [Methanoculleus marisnigri]
MSHLLRHNVPIKFRHCDPLGLSISTTATPRSVNSPSSPARPFRVAARRARSSAAPPATGKHLDEAVGLAATIKKNFEELGV